MQARSQLPPRNQNVPADHFRAGNNERRSQRRYATTEIPATASLVQEAKAHPDGRPCILRDISCGGMSVSTCYPLQKGQLYDFVIALGKPFDSIVLATARACWVKSKENGVEAGLQFIWTSTGWLGPDD